MDSRWGDIGDAIKYTQWFSRAELDKDDNLIHLHPYTPKPLQAPIHKPWIIVTEIGHHPITY